MSYLVDSDVLMDALNGMDWATSFLDERAGEVFHVSIISLGEIFDGALGARDPVQHLAAAQAFLAPYVVLPLSTEIMMRFAHLRVWLRRRGQLIADFDLLIAATALENGLVLITRNRRHYERIPELTLYDI